MECIYSPEEFAYFNHTKRLLEFQVMFYFLFTKKSTYNTPLLFIHTSFNNGAKKKLAIFISGHASNFERSLMIRLET